MERQVRIPRRAFLIIVSVAIVGAILVVPATRERIASAVDPRATAPASELVAQRELTERAIQRAASKALEQARTARGLRLAISDREADAILEQTVVDLRALRREALTALAQTLGMSGADLTTYVQQTEVRLDQTVLDQTPALLAPRLYTIVQRTSQVAQQIADKATQELTRAPTPAPASTSAPARTASPSPTGSR
ncbi:MAG TPA: hypothetical protein VFW12_05080 [Candidatus Limnocylindria bacterium]|nr:hypothetical protein [Candidatus Limnocylindria bacterium]